ncbi:hypothetical protein ADUPG1_010907 [Aduncisulcus paluster]|uniref:Uncharacterized protein n=1 Tax=Aduncisulcus paluster TaxID=2918883 RepID=A0ABQ5JTD8_9EUKA|nr:hypothetical protein ADUPG1_010907 [Aduncisulcus paluster]
MHDSNSVSSSESSPGWCKSLFRLLVLPVLLFSPGFRSDLRTLSVTCYSFRGLVTTSLGLFFVTNVVSRKLTISLSNTSPGSSSFFSFVSPYGDRMSVFFTHPLTLTLDCSTVGTLNLSYFAFVLLDSRAFHIVRFMYYIVFVGSDLFGIRSGVGSWGKFDRIFFTILSVINVMAGSPLDGSLVLGSVGFSSVFLLQHNTFSQPCFPQDCHDLSSPSSWSLPFTGGS